MNYLIGEKSKFAIQFEFSEEINVWLVGKICYWVEGKMLGNYSLILSLRDVLNDIKGKEQNFIENGLPIYYKQIRDSIFKKITAISLIEFRYFIENYLEDDTIFNTLGLDLDAIYYVNAFTDILPNIETFNDVSCFVLQDENNDIIIYKNYDEDDFHKFSLEKKYCYNILLLLLHKLEEIHKIYV
jgi:hypothetical protein